MHDLVVRRSLLEPNAGDQEFSKRWATHDLSVDKQELKHLAITNHDGLSIALATSL